MNWMHCRNCTHKATDYFIPFFRTSSSAFILLRLSCSLFVFICCAVFFSFLFYIWPGLAWPVFTVYIPARALYTPNDSVEHFSLLPFIYHIAFCIFCLSIPFYFINNVQYVLALACHSSTPININDSVVILRSFLSSIWLLLLILLLFFLRFSVKSLSLYVHCERCTTRIMLMKKQNRHTQTYRKKKASQVKEAKLRRHETNGRNSSTSFSRFANILCC